MQITSVYLFQFYIDNIGMVTLLLQLNLMSDLSKCLILSQSWYLSIYSSKASYHVLCSIPQLIIASSG